MWLRKKEIAEKLDKTTRAIDYMIKEGKLETNGKKYGKLRIRYDAPDGDPDNVDSGESLEEAKVRKMIAEANLAELKHPREVERIKKEFGRQVVYDVLEAMKPLNDALRGLRLAPEQNKKINDCWEESVNRLKKQLGAYE